MRACSHSTLPSLVGAGVSQGPCEKKATCGRIRSDPDCSPGSSGQRSGDHLGAQRELSSAPHSEVPAREREKGLPASHLPPSLTLTATCCAHRALSSRCKGVQELKTAGEGSPIRAQGTPCHHAADLGTRLRFVPWAAGIPSPTPAESHCRRRV